MDFQNICILVIRAYSQHQCRYFLIVQILYNSVVIEARG